jgi:hypothetical protein
MNAPRWQRFAAGCGILFVVFFVVGLALQATGASSSGVSSDEVIAHYSDSSTELRRELGATSIGFAVFFLLIFLGGLRQALRSAESAPSVFSSSAFAGGIAMAVSLGVSASFGTAVASTEGFWDNYEVDGNTPLLFADMALWTLGFAVIGAAVLIGSTSLIAWKTRLFPRWLAIAGFVIAALGFFGESTVSFVLPVVLVSAWLLVVSVILTRRFPTRTPARA